MLSERRGGAAYKQTILDTENPRSIERRVFSQITRDLENLRLEEAAENLSVSQQEALSRNQQLWNSLMFDCMEPENPLPDSLKAGVISLAIFVDRHTSDVMTGKKTVDALIAINRRMISGLKGVAPAEQTAAAG